MTGALQEILREIQGYGILVDTLTPDGTLRRYGTRDKANSQSAWVVVFEDGGGAVCGDWRQGWTRHVSANGNGATYFIDSAKADAARAEARRLREQDKAHAADRARQLYSKAKPADPDHAYLKRKGVGVADGVKQSGNLLIIPVMDQAGNVQSLQYISPDGSKKFLKGGATAGGLFVIRGDDGPLFVAEGYATAYSVHMATGGTVLVCFNCGNMAAVAGPARAKYPGRTITLCADNDQKEVEG